MKIVTFGSIKSLMTHFGFSILGKILEPDIHVHEDYTDDNDRKYHDAEVLTTMMANLTGDCLEIGTSTGRGTYKLATNTSGTVFTVNALPEQIGGNLVTHALTKDKIGAYLVEKGISNFRQIYANSLTWDVPENIDGLSLVFVDGCHDAEYVYSDSVKTYSRIKPGGVIIWHDFSPDLKYSPKHFWINSSMMGVDKFCNEMKISHVYHLKNSWIGFAKK